MLTAGVDLPLRAIREQISSAFDLIVQVSRLVDGTRRITHITEVLRMESDIVTLQDIFLAKPVEDAAEQADAGHRLLGPADLHRHQAAASCDKMAATASTCRPTSSSRTAASAGSAAAAGVFGRAVGQ